jgi:hypothetical protein
MTRKILFFRNASAVGLLTVIAVSPLPLASNRDWAWSPLAVAVGTMLLLCATDMTMRARALASSMLAYICSILAAAVLAWVLMQLFAGSLLGEARTFESISAGLGLEVLPRVPFDAERATASAMKLVTYAGVFLLGFYFCSDRDIAERLCWTVVGSAIVVTVYGWAMEIVFRSCVAITMIKRPLESHAPCTFSGTFVNSGNYATFAGLAALVCVAQLQSLFFRSPFATDTTRHRWIRMVSTLSGRGSIYLGALIVLVGGMVFSSSRSGIAAFLIAAIAMTFSVDLLQRRGRTRAIWVTVWLLVATATLLLVSGENIVRRTLFFLSEGDADRTALWHLSQEAVAQRPWTGWGLGSFEGVYSLLQPPTLVLPFDKAHNSYLESAIELGIPTAIGFFAILVFLTGRCFNGMRIRVRDAQLPAIGFGCSVFVALHSLVDFGAQIPAVAIAYASLLGLGCAQSRSSRER